MIFRPETARWSHDEAALLVVSNVSALAVQCDHAARPESFLPPRARCWIRSWNSVGETEQIVMQAPIRAGWRFPSYVQS